MNLFRTSSSLVNCLKRQSPSLYAGVRTFGNGAVYHAGLRKTEFTDQCNISSESQLIPIFRVMDYEGKLGKGWEPPFTLEECVEKFKFMIRLRVYDNLLYNIQRQGRISFYMQNHGEEAMLCASGWAIKEGDIIWSQYRELGALMARGMTVTETLNQLFSTSEEPGKGRQMPICFTSKKIGLQTISTPLTTQLPHAAGSGYAHTLAEEDRVSIVYFGEGAASEGDFHAAMNFAATLKSQTMFLCRNNGYAISTPVEHQYAGDGIAIRGLAYGMDSVRVDGNDFFASYIATQRARETCIKNRAPVCVEYMTYRMGHHSTSDDSSAYRSTHEMSKWNEQGVDGVDRLRRFLELNGVWDEAQEEEVRKDAKQFMLSEIKIADNKKACPIIPGIFDDVYDKEPWHLEEQREELRGFLQRKSHLYDLSKFPGLE